MSNPDIQRLVSAALGPEMVAEEALRVLLRQPGGREAVEGIRAAVLKRLKNSEIADENAHRYLEVLAPAIDSANLVVERVLRDDG
ncbi:hypothetical protein ASE63_22425 [Bosea sp. Root381]|uniref:hypothetical protein n=1 Tax=Bosea sp. Root381 TaxID=1736524 RepID=UPI000714CA70|nr:hypothetical protein [Bosea sp. Root381]KRE07458.1 hypothetical protein ASE63_22425 [Bosea sp. Root381]